MTKLSFENGHFGPGTVPLTTESTSGSLAINKILTFSQMLLVRLPCNEKIAILPFRVNTPYIYVMGVFTPQWQNSFHPKPREHTLYFFFELCLWNDFICYSDYFLYLE